MIASRSWRRNFTRPSAHTRGILSQDGAVRSALSDRHGIDRLEPAAAAARITWQLGGRRRGLQQGRTRGAKTVDQTGLSTVNFGSLSTSNDV